MSTAMSNGTIELDHVGPIARLSIPVPPDGGVVVLHGASGAGKTHAIAAVRALSDAGSRKSLRASDGVPSGKIEGLGVTVRLGRSNTARGELVCEALDSGVDPSVLVDPGLKDPVAADSRRLATLVRLAGVKIPPEQWVALCGDAADEIAVGSLVDPDPVVTADKIRRRLHDLALAKERLSESKAGESATLRKSVADVDLSIPCDEQSLVAAISKAAAKLNAAEQLVELAASTAAAREEAKRQLNALKDTACDVDACASELAHCVEMVDQWKGHIELAQDEVAACEAKLAEAKQRLRDENEHGRLWGLRHTAAIKALDQAKAQAAQIDALERSIGEATIEPPTAEQLAKLQAERDKAIADSQQGEVVRRAKSQLRQADLLASIAEGEAKTAESLRQRARSTDEALEQALVDAGFTDVKVYDGRLCVESERGLEPVSELSTGERWRLALDLAARGLKRGAILAVQQEGWQALDHDLRREVAAMAKERGLVLITAEVDAGDIRAEVL